MTAGPRHFDADAITAATPWPALIATIAEAFAGGGAAPLRSSHAVPDGVGQRTLLTMPAWTPGGDLGVKLVTVSPGNAARGSPTIAGLYVLFNAGAGSPIATFDAACLTARRTAATSALAADRLAAPGATRLLVVGAGPLAAALAQAHASVRRYGRIAIWSRDGDRAAAMAGALQTTMAGVDIVAAVSLEGEAREADVVSTATSSEGPLVLGTWLRPGAHLDLVGAHRPSMREVDAQAIAQADKVYVDEIEAARAEAGDLIAAEREGAFSFGDVAGDLRDLAGMARLRRAARERTVFKSVGHGLEDLAAARLCMTAAQGSVGDGRVTRS